MDMGAVVDWLIVNKTEFELVHKTKVKKDEDRISELEHALTQG